MHQKMLEKPQKTAIIVSGSRKTEKQKQSNKQTPFVMTYRNEGPDYGKESGLLDEQHTLIWETY